MNLPFGSFAIPSLHGLHFARPHAFYLLGAVGAVLAWSLWQARSLSRALAPLIRALALALMVTALADPQAVTHSEGVTRPVMVDASASITPAMRAYTIALLRDQLKLHDLDPVTMFARTTAAGTFGSATAALTSPAGCVECGADATDLEAALTALAADPAAHDGTIALVTDGWENRGNVDAALDAVRAAGIRLFIFTPPGAEAIPNIAMTQLALPPALEKAEPFTIGVTLSNLNAVAAGGTIELYQNARLIDQRTVTLAPGQTRFDFAVRAEESGLASYRAVFKPANPALDTYPEDNSLEGWTGIGAQRKVLILSDNSRDASYLELALRRMGLAPTVVALAGGDYSGSPKGYDAVILNNVPRARLSAAAQNALVEYVNGGGSLAMVGGDQSFGLGGYAGSAIAETMPVVMKPPERHERTRALVLIIDKSGSMGRNDKLTYAKAAALTVGKTLGDSDLLSVIGFDSQPFVIIPLEPMSQIRPYFASLIGRLAAHGTTYLLPALEEADRTLAQSKAAIKHVVILTDGETGGTAAMYYDLVSSMHHDNAATVSTIAVGREANLALLEAIAKYGGGGFYQTDSASDLPELFVEDVHQRGGGDTTMVEKSFTPYGVTPDPVLKELGGRQWPPLKGFVATDLKPGATLSLYVNSDGRRDPILASWKHGAGKTLAMTTDASGRWSGDWIRDDIYAPLWDKMIAWMTPQTPQAQKFAVALGYMAGRITVNLTDYSDKSGVASRPLDATITAPDRTRFDVTLSPRAPGELGASFEAAAPGTYNIELRAPRGSGELTFPPLAYSVSPAVNAELPRPAPNYGLLEHLASATDGRLNPSPSELAISRPLFEQTASLSPWLIVTAMILLIAEALVRRLTF
ncbi:MAG TPA: VWA domain-containing protein [Candidatus Binataceae bacterium]|nr:VWA domain-containing protein [Candidatus Binataceae bacterium]